MKTTVTLVSLRGNVELQAVDARDLGITQGGVSFHVTERTVAARRSHATLKEGRKLNPAVNADDGHRNARAIYLEPDLTVQVLVPRNANFLEHRGRKYRKMVVTRS